MTEDPHPQKASREQHKIPPTLVPPDARDRVERRSSRTVPLLIMGCGVLLVIVALLVLFLPLQQDNRGNVQQTAPQETQPITLKPPQQGQDTVNDGSAREINQLMGVWLQKQAEAEAVNITIWGGATYSEAVSLAKECDQLLGERQYLVARESCQGAIETLNDLMASKNNLLEKAITTGLLALEQGDPDAATDHFRQALAIDANEERAATGAYRAEQLPAVLNFLKDGLAMEKAGDSDGALLAFSEAAALDPDFAPAKKALARIRAEIAKKEFQQAMSRALQAMAEGKPSAARAALKKAQAIRPEDRAVRDLQQQISQTQLSGQLTVLRQDAERLENEERWPEALKTCEKALAMDSQAAFASSCIARVKTRINLDNRLRAILTKPERLFEEGPRKEARQTLAQALEMTPRGPTLASQSDQLEKLIIQAEAENEVVILSDGLTDVVIYHVGRLGSFKEKSLILRTGNYTATGSRNGFRDVRQTLKVRPGSGKMVFTLRCEEPI